MSILLLSAKLSSIILTTADPLIAPSAPALRAFLTCCGVEIPKPNTGGAALYFVKLLINELTIKLID